MNPILISPTRPRHPGPRALAIALSALLVPACTRNDSLGTAGNLDAAVDGAASDGGGGAWDAPDAMTDAPLQHPYASTGAACINYPADGYRVFPYDPFIAAGQRWPECTLNCTAVVPVVRAPGPPLDQAFPRAPVTTKGPQASPA